MKKQLFMMMMMLGIITSFSAMATHDPPAGKTVGAHVESFIINEPFLQAPTAADMLIINAIDAPRYQAAEEIINPSAGKSYAPKKPRKPSPGVPKPKLAEVDRSRYRSCSMTC